MNDNESLTTAPHSSKMLPNVLSHYRTTGKAADTNGKKERTKDKMDRHPLLDAVFLAAEAHLGGSHVLQGFFGQ